MKLRNARLWVDGNELAAPHSDCAAAVTPIGDFTVSGVLTVTHVAGYPVADNEEGFAAIADMLEAVERRR